jgi:hypothetical protein
MAREEFVGSGPMQWLLRQSVHVICHEDGTTRLPRPRDHLVAW